MLLLLPGHDGVHKAPFQQKLCAPEALRELGPYGLFDHSRPTKRISAPGSARIMSASIAKEAVTPPVVGSVSSARQRSFRPGRGAAPRRWSWPSASERGCPPACVRRRRPSRPRRAGFRSAANSKVRVIFSPTTVPIEPIINCASITNSAHSSPPMRAVPQTTPSGGRSTAGCARSRIRKTGVLRGHFRPDPSKLPSSQSMRRRASTFMRRWWPQWGQTSRFSSMSCVSTAALQAAGAIERIRYGGRRALCRALERVAGFDEHTFIEHRFPSFSLFSWRLFSKAA